MPEPCQRLDYADEDRLLSAIVDLKDRIAASVAVSPAAGAAVQVRVPRRFLRDFERDDFAERLIGNLLACLEALR